MKLLTIPTPQGFRIRDEWMLPIQQLPCAYRSRNRANNVRNHWQRLLHDLGTRVKTFRK